MGGGKPDVYTDSIRGRDGSVLLSYAWPAACPFLPQASEHLSGHQHITQGAEGEQHFLVNGGRGEERQRQRQRGINR